MMKRPNITKGDYAGHPFRGNQYTGGIYEGGSGDAGKSNPVEGFRRGLSAKAKKLQGGKKVTVTSVKDAYALIDYLHDKAVEASKQGKEAKGFDLCKVTVPGTNLFCGDNKGIKRIGMPQLGGHEDRFVSSLKAQGIKVKTATKKAKDLKATQNELVGSQVAGMMNNKEFDPKDRSILVSKDGYIVDGHHRWATQVGRDSGDGKLGDLEMRVTVIDKPILEVIEMANDFADSLGLKRKSGTDTGASTGRDSDLKFYYSKPKIKKAQPTPSDVHVDGIFAYKKKDQKLEDEEELKITKGSGGLTRWFNEKWVDISRPKKGGGFEPCGRSDASSGKYPKCVPAAKAARMSEEQRRSAVSRKRKAESSQKREGKKPINVSTFKKGDYAGHPFRGNQHTGGIYEHKAKYYDNFNSRFFGHQVSGKGGDWDQRGDVYTLKYGDYEVHVSDPYSANPNAKIKEAIKNAGTDGFDDDMANDIAETVFNVELDVDVGPNVMAEVDSVYNAGEGEIQVTLQITKGGGNIGIFEATMYLGDRIKSVAMDEMRLSVQGQGIGSALFRHWEDQFARIGVEEMTATAVSGGGFNGAWTWLKTGFVPNGEDAVDVISSFVHSGAGSTTTMRGLAKEFGSAYQMEDVGIGELSMNSVEETAYNYIESFDSPADAMLVLAYAEGEYFKDFLKGLSYSSGDVQWSGSKEVSKLKIRKALSASQQVIERWTYKDPVGLENDDPKFVEQLLKAIKRSRKRPKIKKGDYVGHPFRGNQHTGGIPDPIVNLSRSPELPARLRMGLSNSRLKRDDKGRYVKDKAWKSWTKNRRERGDANEKFIADAKNVAGKSISWVRSTRGNTTLGVQEKLAKQKIRETIFDEWGVKVPAKTVDKLYRNAEKNYLKGAKRNKKKFVKPEPKPKPKPDTRTPAQKRRDTLRSKMTRKERRESFEREQSRVKAKAIKEGLAQWRKDNLTGKQVVSGTKRDPKEKLPEPIKISRGNRRGTRDKDLQSERLRAIGRKQRKEQRQLQRSAIIEGKAKLWRDPKTNKIVFRWIEPTSSEPLKSRGAEKPPKKGFRWASDQKGKPLAGKAPYKLEYNDERDGWEWVSTKSPKKGAGRRKIKSVKIGEGGRGKTEFEVIPPKKATPKGTYNPDKRTAEYKTWRKRQERGLAQTYGYKSMKGYEAARKQFEKHREYYIENPDKWAIQRQKFLSKSMSRGISKLWKGEKDAK